MPAIVVWHNPRCGTSRKALELLRERGAEPDVRLYLEDPPDEAELRDALRKLGARPRDLMRKKEKLYAELALADQSLPDATLIRAMVENPILIERPVAIAGERAVVGRPAEKVLEVAG